MLPPSEFSRLLLQQASTLWLVVCSRRQLPRDPQGTLERVRGGTLRVGGADNPQWAISRDDREPAGLEAILLRQIARSLDANIEWVVYGESELLASRIVCRCINSHDNLGI